ncbi:TPA: DUF4236 domain-containing protein [Escherichia coli]|nr:DUF4236 domain-containing protein [Escherichia coli]
MGLRFRQSFTLFPGVRLNVGKNGISTSIGVPGATVNVSKHCVRATVGLPGSGLSYSANLAKFGGCNTPQHEHPAQPPQYYIPPAIDTMRPITSAGVEYLTSDSLMPLRDLIMAAHEQRSEICADLLAARELATKQSDEILKRKNSLFSFFYKKRIAELEAELPTTRAEVIRLEEWEEQTHIDVKFDAGNYSKQTWANLERAFEKMARSAKIWDVTAERGVNQFVERTIAGRMVDRSPVKFDFSRNDLLKFEGQALRFGNINGEDILLYPGMALIPGRGSSFAIIDWKELELTGRGTRFHESDSVPHDAKVVGHTWAKTNKDGSPDKRFRENYQIPVALYGYLFFNTDSGLNEEYMLSNVEAVEEFCFAVHQHKQALELAE